MKINDKHLVLDRELWIDAGVALPKFDKETVRENTLNRPQWLHFGAGNIFRAFPCALQQDLLNREIEDTGIVVAEGYDFEIIDKIYKPNDNNGLLVTLKVNGETEKTVISSVVESLTIDQSNVRDFERLKAIFKNPTLQMVSFTITEKGYNVTNAKGDFFPDVQIDLQNDITQANSYIGKLVSLLHTRFENGRHPIALVSMDNCSENGSRLYKAVSTLALEWEKQGSVSHDFIDYINSKDTVSFPWSMIDKITPRPDEDVEQDLARLGFEDSAPIITTKGTYVAPFVNAEEAQYLVIEDLFPNGRPQLEKAGVMFTNRETVDKVEKMKVGTCLNPLHTALAIFGCLLSYTKISDEMKDEDLVTLISKIGYDEGLPVVVNPKILNPESFIDEVINVRFPNPFMPDTPQRIATDTSQKLSIRFLETIRSYHESDILDVKDLKLIPLVIAGWIRYLMGVNDEGVAFEISSDPLMDTLKPIVDQVKLGDTDYQSVVREILMNEQVFNLDLYEVGLGDRIESYFGELIAGPHAVRTTLHKYVTQ